jgi:hypothetical protein
MQLRVFGRTGMQAALDRLSVLRQAFSGEAR